MKQLFARFAISLAVMLSLGAAVALPASAAGATCGSGTSSSKDQVLAGAGVGQTTNDCGQGVTNLAQAAVQILSLIVGIASIIMIIVAGLKYTTSGGDSNRVGSAKSTLIYALIGVAVAVLAQFFVHFVLGKVQT